MQLDFQINFKDSLHELKQKHEIKKWNKANWKTNSDIQFGFRPNKRFTAFTVWLCSYMSTLFWFLKCFGLEYNEQVPNLKLFHISPFTTKALGFVFRLGNILSHKHPTAGVVLVLLVWVFNPPSSTQDVMFISNISNSNSLRSLCPKLNFLRFVLFLF